MSLYTVQNGKIVDAYSGKEINLSDEQDRLDWRENRERYQPAMNRIVGLILLESERQSLAPAR